MTRLTGALSIVAAEFATRFKKKTRVQTEIKSRREAAERSKTEKCVAFFYSKRQQNTIKSRPRDLLLSRLPARSSDSARIEPENRTLSSLSCSVSGEFKQHTRFFGGHTLLAGFSNSRQSSFVTFLRLKTDDGDDGDTIEPPRYCQLLVHICHIDCEARRTTPPTTATVRARNRNTEVRLGASSPELDKVAAPMHFSFTLLQPEGKLFSQVQARAVAKTAA